jgi:hypothetical protein
MDWTQLIAAVQSLGGDAREAFLVFVVAKYGTTLILVSGLLMLVWGISRRIVAAVLEFNLVESASVCLCRDLAKHYFPSRVRPDVWEVRDKLNHDLPGFQKHKED